MLAKRRVAVSYPDRGGLRMLDPTPERLDPEADRPVQEGIGDDPSRRWIDTHPNEALAESGGRRLVSTNRGVERSHVQRVADLELDRAIAAVVEVDDFRAARSERITLVCE